ncbi:MAG TPA: YfjI family protein [Solirubrobacteraceae bacterium]|jgi:replicative DNA helicase|nr:YfjI family protein [Solirubrobacteraceae bacterium]
MSAPPEFPIDALPAPVAAWVQAVAEESQTPPDLAAMAALGVLSAAAMGAAVVDCGGWAEELPLYLLVAMPSGDRKSTVMRAAQAPLRAVERERRENAAPVVRERQARRDVLEKRAAKLTKTAAEHGDSDTRQEAASDLVSTLAERDEIGDPVLPRILVDDATPEALAGLLARHPALAIVASESALLDNVSGRYGDGGANLHLVCSAYSGEPTTIDRRGREPETIDRPLLTVALAVQPHVLEGLISNRTARAQGLVGRFAYSTPETRLGARRTRSARVPDAVQAKWAQVVRFVADKNDTNTVSVGSVGTLHGKQIALTPAAADLLHQLRAAHEPHLAEGRELAPIADWVARHHGRIARIAGLLHLTEHPIGEPISESTMRDALAVGAYLLDHALAALTGPDALTRRALKWLVDRETVSIRDLQRGPLGGRGTAEEAAALAEQLVQFGALDPVAPDNAGRGRPGSPTFKVNPADKTDRNTPIVTFYTSKTADRNDRTGPLGTPPLSVGTIAANGSAGLDADAELARLGAKGFAGGRA